MKTSAIAVVAMLCGACASVPDQASGSREYRTGSNLPVRDRNAASMQTVDKSSLDQWRIPPAAHTLGTGP
jgi:hypothetical protein